MKRWIAFLLAWTLMLSLVACAASDAPQTTDASTEAATEPVSTEKVVEDTTEPMLFNPEGMERSEEPVSQWEEVEVPEDAEVIPMSGDTIAPDAMKADLQAPVDPYRPWYDLGTSGTFTGDTYTLLFFLSDDESDWTYDAAMNFIQNNYFAAETWLSQQAAYWGVNLNFRSGYFLDNSADENYRYNGIIGDNSSTGYTTDILEQAAQAVGYESAREMHEGIQEYTGVEKISIVIVVNKPGRSYATMDWYNDGYEFVEYCVIFAQDLHIGDLVYAGCPSTIAHEMLHLYGAEDFYAAGDQRNGRARLADNYYYNGIMNRSYFDISYNYVDQFTAYAVGWTNSTPSVCYDPDWWD